MACVRGTGGCGVMDDAVGSGSGRDRVATRTAGTFGKGAETSYGARDDCSHRCWPIRSGISDRAEGARLVLHPQWRELGISVSLVSARAKRVRSGSDDELG